MNRTKLIVCISDLSRGLTDAVAKERMVEGIEYIYTLKIDEFEDKLVNLILMPMFAHSVHRQHRFDIPATEYVDHLTDIVRQEFRPNSELRFETKHGVVLTKSVDVDQEADYMEQIANRTFDYIDMILPKV